MGIFDSLTGSNGLFGLGGSQGMMNPSIGLLGNNIDQQAMRNYTLKNMLLGAGVGLLSQGPSLTPQSFGSNLGQGLAAGLTQGQQAQQDYIKNAMLGQQMKVQNQQMQLATNADQRAAAAAGQQTQLFPGQLQSQGLDLASKQRASDNAAGFQKWLATNPDITPDMKALAASDPQSFAQMYMSSKLPIKPTWSQIGQDMYGRPQYGYPPAYDPSQSSHAQTSLPANANQGNNQDLTGLTGTDYIQNLASNKGQGYANQVQAIIEGRAPYPTGMLIKTPYGQQLATDVTQADPTFETGNAQSRNKLRTDATSGKLGTSTNAISTALVHLGQTADNLIQLPNGNYPLVNGVKQAFVTGTGGDAYTNFNTTMGKVSAELTSAYRNGGGNEADIQRELSNISPTSSPTQITGSLLNTAKLLKGKIDANQEQVDKGMGSMGGKIQLSNPKVDEIIARLEALHLKALSGQPLTEGVTQTSQAPSSGNPALDAALAKYQ